MSSIGDIIVRALRGETILDEEALSELLISDKEARRMVLCDRELRYSDDPVDIKFYRAVTELAKSKGDIETLSYELQPRKGEDLETSEPSIGDLIAEMYGGK